MPESIALSITEDQMRQYVEEGYFILEGAVDADTLAALRGECTRFIGEIDARMDAAGTQVEGINHRGKRYFITLNHPKSEALTEFVFSEAMAEICRATIGADAFVFMEQFVVKMAEVGMTFSWHQDSGYVSHGRVPYVSCWCALDDMTLENGTISVLPYSRAGTRERVRHDTQEGTNDRVGYHGDDPGIPVIVPAGSIAVFSSTLFHCSGANTTSRPRRSYLVQYSAAPIMRNDGAGPWALARQFMVDGKIDRADDHPIVSSEDWVPERD